MPPGRQPLGAPENFRRGEDTTTTALVEDLSRRFATFRRESPRHARVPRELRAAVVAAIGHGVPPARLRAACGVSTSQLDRWRTASTSGASFGGELQRARVFSVTGDPSPRPVDAGGWPPHDGLELRLGPWSVSVRLARQHEADRG